MGRQRVAASAPAPRAVRAPATLCVGRIVLRRTFAFDVLDCPECGGRLRLLAAITQREVIERIISHLGLPIEPVSPEPAQSQENLLA